MSFRFDVISIYPDAFDSIFKSGIISRRFEEGTTQLYVHNPRDYALDRYRKVDDEPYGGGPGMILKPEPFYKTLESIPINRNRRILMMTPQGRCMTQKDFQRWSKYKQIVLICGSYEGFDERIRNLADEEISLGDFVLTGGEIPAMSIINGVVRLLPGTLGSMESLKDESHNELLLEHPQYTRPADFSGLKVPKVLLSGNHREINKWRQQQKEVRTKNRRPDLYYSWQSLNINLLENNKVNASRLYSNLFIRNDYQTNYPDW